ncbi:MAG: phosphatase PAP2 family protein [Deltaproteobacteria bacterium]|nr:phosphatase PAP2 family protein [Deltaproteobacteria bacterium]
MAVLVAIGRIGAGLHYPSDTVAGALLGIASGIAAHWFIRKNEHRWAVED